VVFEPVCSPVWVGRRGSDLHGGLAEDAPALRRAFEGILPLTAVQLHEVLPGQDVGLLCLVQQGQILAAFAYERLHAEAQPGGGSSYRRSIVSPASLEAAATQILAHLRWHGVADVQFRFDTPSNRFWLRRVGAGFGDALPLAMFAGVDFPAALLDMWRGREPALRTPRTTTLYARHLAADATWWRSRQARGSRPAGARTGLEWGRVFVGRERWDGASLADPLPIVHEVTATLWAGAHAAATHALASLQHRQPRAAARERLAERRDARRILVLCHGNICRSPYAGARLAAAGAALELEVRTAGFSRYVDRTPPEMYRRLAAARGIDLRGHRSAHIELAMLDWADLILVMDAANARELAARDARRARRAVVLGALDPEGGSEIRDPYELPAQEMAAVLAQIDRCIATLVRVLGDGRRAA
jgi:protein-tyrosine-phosphatase